MEVRLSGHAKVKEYLEGRDFDVFENANRYPGPTGLLTYVAEKYLKEEVMYREIPVELARLHEAGLLYIHKLPYSLFIPYCCGHSVARLLEKGLVTPTINARPARHLDTYVDHVANYLMAMQHYFSGAQALGAVELYAGPFIRKDRADYERVKQQVQRLIYNLNFPSRAGMQTPFTNFTVVLDASKVKLSKDPAYIAGKEVGKIGDYLDEARLFVRAIYEVHSEGDAIGRPFTFPIPTIMTTSKLLYEDPEIFEAVFNAAAKMGAGYWLNTRIVDPDASFAMCCRINIDMNELSFAARRPSSFRLGELRKEVELAREEWVRNVERQRMGGLWAIPDITGSVGVVTVNIPRLVIESGFDDEVFYERLDELLLSVKVGLLWMRERYHRMSRKFPHFYSMPLMYVPEVFSLRDGPYFNTIGVLGLPEAAALMARDPTLWFEGSRSARLKAAYWMRDVVQHIVQIARKWSTEVGTAFNVEEVPGESAAAKLAAKDARIYPELVEYLPEGEEGPVYSTSVAPYYGELSLWERVEVEEVVQKHFTGGVMMHIFLGEEPDPEALASLTKKLTYNSELVYWSYTPALTVCPHCGWRSVGMITTCPRCGSETEVWSRIIGYYRPLKNWNPARRREFWTRKHYRV